MHSFVLLALASSALAIPVHNGVVNAPVDAKAPVGAVVNAAAKVVAPVKAAVGNVDAKKVNVANELLSDNTLLRRGGPIDSVVNVPAHVVAPVKAAVDAVVKADAPVKAAVANANVKDVNAANDILSENYIAKRDGAVNAPVNVDAPVKAIVNVAGEVIAPVEAAIGNVGLKDIKGLNSIASDNVVARHNPTDIVANAPVDVFAPVKAIVDAAAGVKVPVDAAVGNVKAEKVNVANGILSGNTIAKRHGGVDALADAPVLVKAPVDAVVNTAAKVEAPVKAAVANVDVKDANVANKILSGNTVARRHGGVDDLVGAPAKVIAPVDALVNAAAEVVAPVAAAVGNVGLKDVNIGNGIASGNKIARQEGLSVPALPTVLGSTQANATKIVATVQGLLSSTPAGAVLAGPLSELNSVLTGAVSQLGLLNGLGLSGILDAKDGEVEVSTQQAAETVTGLTKTVSGVVQQVTEKLGNDVPELKPVIALLNGSVNSLVSTVTSLVPGVTPALGTLLTPLSGTLNSVGLGLGLSAVGL